jgi:RHS repeat-associated protein
VYLNGSITSSLQHVFAYSDGQITLQFEKPGPWSIGREHLAHRYLWGPAVDELLADEEINSLTNAALNTVLWPLTDHLGTVRDWLDSAANVLDHVEYNSFGKRIDSTVVVDAAFGWTGRYRDPLTGLQYNNARWYDPTIGRWLSEDFIWDGWNKYSYVGNTPTIYVDPTGLWGVAVGHHYFPLAEQSYFGSKLTDAARRLAEGYYTGGTNPPHGYLEYGGVRHCDYNAAVRKEFTKYLKQIGKDKRGKVNMEEMRTFIEKHLKNGKGDIGNFNKAVERTVIPSPRRVDPMKMTNNQLKELGKKLRRDRSGFMSARLLGALAVAGGLAVRQSEGFLDACASSPYLRRAYNAADRGDLEGTTIALLGSRAKNSAYGLYDELVSRGLSLAALDFERAMTEILEDIRDDRDDPIGDRDE